MKNAIYILYKVTHRELLPAWSGRLSRYSLVCMHVWKLKNPVSLDEPLKKKRRQVYKLTR